MISRICWWRNWAILENCIWLNTGEDGKIQIWPCKECKRKVLISWVFIVLTAGFLKLLFYWRPLLYALYTCDYCQAEYAELVLIKYQEEYSIRVVRTAMWTDGLTLFCPGGVTIDVLSCRYFVHKKLTFVWHPLVNMFHKMYGLDSDVPLSTLVSQRGLQSDSANKRLAIFGSNEITVDLKPIIILLFREVFSPFYVFQVFSLAVWFKEGYNIYATIICIVSIFSIGVNIWQIRRSQWKLQRIMYSIGVITVWREGEWKKKSSTILVPGDLIKIPPQGEMHCDAVLLRGSVVVNEAMLTGESVPMTKTPIRIEIGEPNERYDSKEHAKYTLFCGTKILQTKHAHGESVAAVVIRTGFNTTKGRLVRTIMYPKPIQFDFTRDLFRFIAVFFIVAVVGFVYTVILMVQRGNGFDKIATRALDIITIVVPPALPAAITIGIIATQRRLKQAMIYCTSPTTINTAGGVNVVCLDKTGTLTEDGMDLFGVIPAYQMEMENAVVDITDLPFDSELVRVMASCHSLTQLHSQLIGDPMDIVLFKKTNWKLDESSAWPIQHASEHILTVHCPHSQTRIGVLREYTFTSSLRRMSVLVQVDCVRSGSKWGLYIFCKGAPETVVTLCTPDSIPAQFFNILRAYTKCGHRVIAVACKQLHNNIQQVLRKSRRELESDLTFLGFIIFENRLKKQTIPNLALLNEANLRSIMVTGDNTLTAISVAKDSGLLDKCRPLYIVEANGIGDGVVITLRPETMEYEPVVRQGKQRLTKLDSALSRQALSIDFDNQSIGFDVEMGKNGYGAQKKLTSLRANYQLAISGSSYAIISSKSPHLLSNLSAVCNVYARMTPEQKVQLITNLQSLGYVVAMCGDGANDCGALKAAHVGCSLSQAEASIASPFTSKLSDISCIPTLIREGRSCLVTTFGIVKYMCCYSLTQFLAVVILHWIGTNLSDFQFLYSDLFLTTTFAIFFGCTRASNYLSPISPPTHILTINSVSSITAQMILILIFQIFSFQFIQYQPWFVPFVFPGDENNNFSYQATCQYFTTAFEQIILCVVYSKSYPYRLSIWSNYILTAALIGTTFGTLILLFSPGYRFSSLLELKLPPNIKYRILIVLLAGLHFLLAIGLEELLEKWVPLWERYLPLPFKKKKRKYVEILESDVGHSPAWLRANVVENEDVVTEEGIWYTNQVCQITEEL